MSTNESIMALLREKLPEDNFTIHEHVSVDKEADKLYDTPPAATDGNGDGILVANHEFKTAMHFTYDRLHAIVAECKAIEKQDWKSRFVTVIKNYTHCGKNVEQMTRVTGYFSKVSKAGVSNWNKGKEAELRDRRRTSVD